MTTAVDFLLDVFRQHETEEAVIFRDRSNRYPWLLDAYADASAQLARAGLEPGSIVSLEADFSPTAIACLLALAGLGTVVAPLSPAVESRRSELLDLAQAEFRVRVGDGDRFHVEPTGRQAEHPLYARLRAEGHPGLVLFSSGYTGAPKGVVHDLSRLLAKYRIRRHRLRTLLFLLFDHIGGVDTLFQALSNGCAVIVPEDRTPERICEAIAKHRVEVLPASPSFLTLMLLSEAHRRHDLSSLRYITYGAEAMPQATLGRVAALFPHVILLQKYGLTEVGTLRSHSEANDSLWVKIGGEGFETRVVDGILQIKAESSMLGYLNAPSPFTPDGWLVTGDAVEVRGDLMRILGRASDLINVGGQKVYPAEVESVVQEVENVAEVAVRGEAHPFTGQIVVARVSLVRPEEEAAVERRIRQHCRARLAPYQVPVKVEFSTGALHTVRQKKTRS